MTWQNDSEHTPFLFVTFVCFLDRSLMFWEYFAITDHILDFFLWSLPLLPSPKQHRVGSKQGSDQQLSWVVCGGEGYVPKENQHCNKMQSTGALCMSPMSHPTNAWLNFHWSPPTPLLGSSLLALSRQKLVLNLPLLVHLNARIPHPPKQMHALPCRRKRCFK